MTIPLLQCGPPFCNMHVASYLQKHQLLLMDQIIHVCVELEVFFAVS